MRTAAPTRSVDRRRRARRSPICRARSVASGPSTACRSTWRHARSSASSARTAPARPRCSISSAGSRPASADASCWAGSTSPMPTPAPRAAHGLGRSFQDARLFPDMTVSETLAVALERWFTNRSALAAALRLPMVFDDEERAALRVDELIELMHLGQYRHSFVRELSTGTRRVVDLACQVAHRPTVILLDEPSSGIAQREVEALVAGAAAPARRDGRRAGGHRARHAADLVDLRPADRARPGACAHHRPAGRRAAAPRGRAELPRHRCRRAGRDR